MYRVAVLVKKNSRLDSSQFEHQWGGVLVPEIAKIARMSSQLRRLVLNVAPEELDADVARVFPAPFDGLLEFWFDSADAAVSVMGELSTKKTLRTLAADVVDVSAGCAWLAEVVPSKPEHGSHVKFLAAGDVATGMTVEDAQAYWRNVHPLVARTAPDVWNRLTRYTQFHGCLTPELKMGDWLARSRFVPMCSDMGFARSRDFIDTYTCEQYARIVRPDEEKFSKPGEMLAFISAEEKELIN